MSLIYEELKLLKTNYNIEIFPPSQNPMEKIADQYRMFILIKSQEISIIKY